MVLTYAAVLITGCIVRLDVFSTTHERTVGEITFESLHFYNKIGSKQPTFFIKVKV
jgi:hypothetical protein